MATDLRQDGPVLYFRIDRPEARNAIDFDVIDKLEETAERIYNDESVRALVITGKGKYFISGGDLRKFHQIRKAEDALKMASRIHKLFERLEQAPCWTIALVNGPAFGGGWETMLACDFRIASSNAVFGFTQSKFYLPPGWGGLTRLVETVGRSNALLWLAEARTIDTDTALDSGLIHYCFDHEALTQKTDEWLKSILNTDRSFIKTLKQSSYNLFKHRSEAIREELAPFSRFWEDDKHRNRVEKFLDKNR